MWHGRSNNRVWWLWIPAVAGTTTERFANTSLVARIERSEMRGATEYSAPSIPDFASLHPDDHGVACFPVVAAAVVDVVALALEHEEHRAVHVAVLAGLAARRIDLHVGLDRLRDLHGLRIDDLLAVAPRTTLPLEVAGAIDPRLAVELVHQVAVGALERAHEHAMLGLALPHDVGERIVVAGAGLSGRCGFAFGHGLILQCPH